MFKHPEYPVNPGYPDSDKISWASRSTKEKNHGEDRFQEKAETSLSAFGQGSRCNRRPNHELSDD
jgi:hypothetical protein